MELRYPGGWYADALPDGGRAVLFENSHVATDRGDIDLPSPGENPLYLVAHRWLNVFYLAGQSHTGRGALLWSSTTGAWQVTGLPCFGVSPCLFAGAVLLVAISDTQYVSLNLETGAQSAPVDCALGGQGFRYVDDAGLPVTGDDSLNGDRRVAVELNLGQLWEYSHVSGITVGQGGEGGAVIRTPDARLLEPGNTTFIRFHNAADLFSVAIVKPGEPVLFWLTRAELLALPAYGTVAPPVVVVVAPPVVIPPPVVRPPEVQPVSDFDPGAVVYHNTSGARVLDWPVTTALSAVIFSSAHEAFNVEFSKKDGPGMWPDVPIAGWNGGVVQYTLGMLQDVNGAWHLSMPIEYWHNRDGAGGPANEVGVNWFYGDAEDAMWGPMKQPAVGERIGLLVAAGSERGKDETTVQERSDVVWINWPAGPQRFDFTSGIPLPPSGPQAAPPDTPTGPATVPATDLAALQAAVTLLEGRSDRSEAAGVAQDARLAGHDADLKTAAHHGDGVSVLNGRLKGTIDQ